jgi:hypothetical protein
MDGSDRLVQSWAIDVPHDVEPTLPIVASGMDIDDPRVVQAGSDHHLPLEQLSTQLGASGALHGDTPAECLILGDEDLSLPADLDQLGDREPQLSTQ